MENLFVKRIKGNGNPLLLFHGWGKNHRDLEPLGKLLSNFYDVYLFDLPGFGQSERPAEPWGTDQYANRIDTWIRENKLADLTLFGHSFGGKIAMHLAVKRGDIVDKLVLMGSAGLKRKRGFSGGIRFIFIALLRFFVKSCSKKWYENWFISQFGSADYKAAGEMRPILVKSVREELSDLAEKISCETILIWGENDQETPLECGQRLAKLIPNNTLIALPGKGHHPHADSGDQLIATLIKERVV
jgi:pimeloyl-ACP methyl ester carboxylesterase